MFTTFIKMQVCLDLILSGMARGGGILYNAIITNFAYVKRLGTRCRIRLTVWGSLDWCVSCDLQSCLHLGKILVKLFDNNIVWTLCTLFLFTSNNSIQTEKYNFSCRVIKSTFQMFTWKIFISFPWLSLPSAMCCLLWCVMFLLLPFWVFPCCNQYEFRFDNAGLS